MKKFKDWCNKNSGFLAFWGIVVMITISIVPPIKVELPALLKALGSFFGFKISVPVYGILIFLVLMGIVFNDRLGNWNKFFFKSIQNKVIEIVSDDSTMFLGSDTFPDLQRDQKAYAHLDGGYWNPNIQFNELATAHWISHTKLISDKEATGGGIYKFMKEFNLDLDPKLTESAELYFIADDHCTMILNSYNLGRHSGFDKLNKLDVKDKLIKGKNTLTIDVINNDGAILNTVKYSKYLNKKGTLNPYGIKYNLRIVIK